MGNVVKALFQPNKQTQDILLRLSVWQSTVPADATVSWLEVQQATGIPMSNANRALVRLAFKRAHRYWTAIKGVGFRAGGPKTAMEIEHSKLRRVTSAVDAATSAAADLSAQYLDQMSAEDQRRMTEAAAFLGAINLSRSIAKMEVRKLSKPKP